MLALHTTQPSVIETVPGKLVGWHSGANFNGTVCDYETEREGARKQVGGKVETNTEQPYKIK